MSTFFLQVYAFDPLMGKENHNRSKNIEFFKLGIGDVDGNLTYGSSFMNVNL